MKLSRVFFAVMVMFLAGLFGTTAMAGLTTIGTATYQNNDYNLIYMDDGPFGPITWLDYTRGGDYWQDQVNWASGLSFAQADIQLNPGYTTSVDWSTGWRLPETVDGQYSWGYDGTTTAGYNITTSEMGYLFYEALGNKGYYDTSGNGPQSGWGLNNTGDFNSLQSFIYWSGTEYSPDPGHAWDFVFNGGSQRDRVKDDAYPYALAVRPGDVSAAVPEPGTILLLGTGLAGLGAYRKRARRRHWVIG